MCVFIGIESLAANALIEIRGKNQKEEVDFEALVKYGSKVVEILRDESGEEAVLLMSKKHQLNMMANYSNYFDVELGSPGQGMFRLKKGVDYDKFSNYFRWAMSMKLINAFMSKKAVNELG